MAIFDTTNSLDTSMLMKSRLPKNMVGENYYIENLQEKRNQDWQYRYNVVDIEEEKHKQVSYSKQLPTYTPIDVTIRSVKSEKNIDLGMDWASISFRDLKYPNKLGSRYRFNLDFPNMKEMSEEDKYYNTSVWMCINKSPISPRNSCVIRRCNCSFAMVGSKNYTYEEKDKEVRFEPRILDDSLKNMNQYYNQTLVLPNAEWYLTLQLNYYTNFIKINNRIIFGGADSFDRQNNSVFKVKAVSKCADSKTFIREGDDGVENIPLVIIALDRDVISDSDDLVHRIATNAPLYRVPHIEEPNEYQITTDELPSNKESKANPFNTDAKAEAKADGREDGIILKDEGRNETLIPNTIVNLVVGETRKYSSVLTLNGKIVDVSPEYTVTLSNIKEENWKNYFEFKNDELNHVFSIKNLKMCRRGTVTVEITYNAGITVKQEYLFKLGGFY